MNHDQPDSRDRTATALVNQLGGPWLGDSGMCQDQDLMRSAASLVSAKNMTAAKPFDVQAIALMQSSRFPANLRICDKAKRASVAALNDGARRAIGERCTVKTTPAFVVYHLADQQVLIDLIAGYDAFDLGTNGFDERDFGVLFKSHDGQWSAATPAGDWSH